MIKIFKNNSLIKNTGIYTITSVLNKAIPFFMLPVLTRYLTPEEYGVISMFTLLVTFTSPFIGLSLNGAIARKYYDQEDTNIWVYVFNSFLILISSTILVSIIFYAFSDIISKLTSFPIKYLWVAIVFTFSHAIIDILLSLLQVQKKAFVYGLFNNLKTIANVALSILFIVFLGYGWQGRLFAQLIAVFFFSGVSIFVLLKKQWVVFSINKKYIIHALTFGIPLIPHALSGSIIAMTDRFFITSMVGLSSTGIYTVGYQIGSIINILAVSFNNAYVPWLYERLKKNNYDVKTKIVKFTYLYFIGIILIAVTLGMFSPYFLNVFLGKSFGSSSIFIIWIALGYAFNGMYLMVVNYIFYSQKTVSLAFVTFITAVINIVLNYFLIKIFGSIGAAYATTFVFLMKFIIVWILSAKVHPMPWVETIVMKKKL